MSLTFRPPDRQIRFRAGDYFRLGSDRDRFWGSVRWWQLTHFDRFLPYLLGIALIDLTLLAVLFREKLESPLFFMLVAAHAAVVAMGHRRRVWRRRNKWKPIARRDMQLSLVNLAAIGCIWGAAIYVLLCGANAQEAGLLVIMVVAGIGCISYATAGWPLGTLFLGGPAMLGLFAGVVSFFTADTWPLFIAIISFLLFMARGVHTSTYTLFARIQLQYQNQQQEEVVHLLLNEFESNGSEWLFEFDVNGRLTFASSRLSEVLGCPIEDVLGRHFLRFLADSTENTELLAAVRRGAPFRDILARVELGHDTRWWLLSGTPKYDHSDRAAGYRGVGMDVTDRQRAAHRIAELATFDALTGLVNRRILHQTLVEMLGMCGCGLDEGVALLFVDLDRFKAVNDSLGHAAGDRLLTEVGDRLRRFVAADEPGGLVGRLGGDEFAVLLPCCTEERAVFIGREAIEKLTRSYRIEGKQVLVGASIGLAIGPRDGDSAEELMRAADLAMYDAKARGRGTVRLYDRSMYRAAEKRRLLELDLRNAIANRELKIVYQPIVDAQNERIVAFEALARWTHPAEGEIPPSVFVPIAEESGQIDALGAFVLRESCRLAVTWPEGIRLAVNVSPSQFDNSALPEDVRDVLQRTNMAPDRLELEMTEGLFLHADRGTKDMLRTLQRLGIGIVLDDFGTGYSSLGYLQKFAFRRIKIDRSFVHGCTSDASESLVIVQAMIALAGRLGIRTIAEGVETRNEFEIMRRLGCDEVQGFYFGRPLPADEVGRVISRNRPLLELVPPSASPSIIRTTFR